MQLGEVACSDDTRGAFSFGQGLVGWRGGLGKLEARGLEEWTILEMSDMESTVFTRWIIKETRPPF